MKIVLLDDVTNVGEAGQLVEVKNGYARNYLIPRRLAEPATRDTLNRIALIKRAADVKRARRMEEASGKFAILADKGLVIKMKAGTESRLFGAVTSAMIADEIKNQFGVDIDRRHVMLEEPIKHLGEFTVPLRASADVTSEIKVAVEPEVKREEIEQKLIEQARADDAAASEAEAEVVESEAAETEPAAPDMEGATAAEQASEAVDVHDKYEEHEEEHEKEEQETP